MQPELHRQGKKRFAGRVRAALQSAWLSPGNWLDSFESVLLALSILCKRSRSVRAYVLGIESSR
jgi:hypothetical protein